MAGRRLVTAGVLAVVALALVATPAGAASATWEESGDAAGIPATAQAATGSGALTRITGRISHFNDDDMFRLCLTGGGTFSARVVPRALSNTFLDPQLFLFDARGRGVYANDDVGVGVELTESLHPLLPAAHPLTPTAAGVYYLAISSYDNDPVSPRGPIFEDVDSTAVIGPDGPGGGRRVIDWDDNAIVPTFSRYTIRLTGARYC